jgi:hypothetical protein
MKPLAPPAGAAATDSAIAGRATAAGAGAARPTGAAPARTSDPRPAAQPAGGLGPDPAARELPPFETASWDVASSEYVTDLRTAMGALLDFYDRSLREVQRVLIAHGCGLDLSRLLSGKVELKVRHVLDICRAIGVHPLELFRLVLKEPRTPNPIIARMAALFGPGATTPTTRPAPDRAEELSEIQALERSLSALQRQMEDLRRRPPGTRAVTPQPPPGRRS